MNIVSVETAEKKIETYLRNEIAAPFFVVVDDVAEYKELIEKFDYLSHKRVSDYCIEEDCFPNTDSLREKLSQESERALLLGVGEYATLSNNNRILGELKDLKEVLKTSPTGRFFQKIMIPYTNSVVK